MRTSAFLHVSRTTVALLAQLHGPTHAAEFRRGVRPWTPDERRSRESLCRSACAEDQMTRARYRIVTPPDEGRATISAELGTHGAKTGAASVTTFSSLRICGLLCHHSTCAASKL